jgi:hypothetical protein
MRRPVPAEELQLVGRLLSGDAADASAPADLADLYFEPLIESLRRRYPSLPDPTLIDAAVGDVLLALAERPSLYHPSKGRLWQYLYMAADGDIKNAWRTESRHRAQEVSLDVVELESLERKSRWEDALLERLSPEGLPAGWTMERLWERVAQEFPEPEYRAVLLAWLEGERATELYARCLKIEHLPGKEQTKRVKNAKDRVDKRLIRLGRKLADEQ